MNRKLYLWVAAWCVVYFVACQFCPAALGQDTKWQLVGLASDEMVSGRVLYTPEGRVKVGGDFSWIEGKGAPDGWRPAFVGTYDLVQEAALKVPVLGEIPTSWYIGGLGGVLFGKDREVDATAALMTGLVLGDKKASIGAEFQYLLTRDLWQPLADIDDTSRVMFYAALRF